MDYFRCSRHRDKFMLEAHAKEGNLRLNNEVSAWHHLGENYWDRVAPPGRELALAADLKCTVETGLLRIWVPRVPFPNVFVDAEDRFWDGRDGDSVFDLHLKRSALRVTLRAV
jgi:hypothetical protein